MLSVESSLLSEPSVNLVPLRIAHLDCPRLILVHLTTCSLLRPSTNMPGFLRSIFKPSGSRTPTSRPRTNTGDFSPTEISPGANSLSTAELDELAEKLRNQLAGSGGGSHNRRSFRNLLNPGGSNSQEPQHGMTREMLDVLDSVSDERRRERVTPFPKSSSSVGHEHGDDVDRGWEKSPLPPPGGSARSSRTDIWDDAYQACCEAIGGSEISELRWPDSIS